VGQERYQFDIWGDTVNVAARMLDQSAPSTVAVTGDVWAMVSSDFEGEKLGELDVKGKGLVPIYSLKAEQMFGNKDKVPS
jgi:class 3 adenylate cyclase